MNQVIKKALSTVERSRAACVTLRGIRNETWRCEAFEEIFLELLFGVREKVRELTPHNRRKKKRTLFLRQTQLHTNKGLKTNEYSNPFS